MKMFTTLFLILGFYLFSSFSFMQINAQTADTPNLSELGYQMGFEQKIVLSFLISFFTVLIITLAVNKWFKKKQFIKTANTKFWFIIRDSDCFPSLALFQFLLWTFVISFSYLGIYLTRVMNGQMGLGPLDGNILIVLGLSIAAPIINKVISQTKYVNEGCKEPLPGYSTMLEENGKISLARFQFFLWTFVAIIIFFSSLAYSISTLNVTNVGNFSLPRIDNTLVYLMGLSQSGYLGVKYVTKINPTITNVLKNQNFTNNNVFTILGNGFGNQNGRIIINGFEFNDEHITKWDEKMIVIIPPSEYIDLLGSENKPISIKIIADSRIVEAKFEDKNGILQKKW